MAGNTPAYVDATRFLPLPDLTGPTKLVIETGKAANPLGILGAFGTGLGNMMDDRVTELNWQNTLFKQQQDNLEAQKKAKFAALMSQPEFVAEFEQNRAGINSPEGLARFRQWAASRGLPYDMYQSLIAGSDDALKNYDASKLNAAQRAEANALAYKNTTEARISEDDWKTGLHRQSILSQANANQAAADYNTAQAAKVQRDILKDERIQQKLRANPGKSLTELISTDPEVAAAFQSAAHNLAQAEQVGQNIARHREAYAALARATTPEEQRQVHQQFLDVFGAGAAQLATANNTEAQAATTTWNLKQAQELDALFKQPHNQGKTVSQILQDPRNAKWAKDLGSALKTMVDANKAQIETDLAKYSQEQYIEDDQAYRQLTAQGRTPTEIWNTHPELQKYLAKTYKDIQDAEQASLTTKEKGLDLLPKERSEKLNKLITNIFNGTNENRATNIQTLLANDLDDRAAEIAKATNPEEFKDFSDAQVKQALRAYMQNNVNPQVNSYAQTTKQVVADTLQAGQNDVFARANMAGASVQTLLNPTEANISQRIQDYLGGVKNQDDPSKGDGKLLAFATRIQSDATTILEKAGLAKTQENRALAVDAILNSFTDNENRFWWRFFTGDEKTRLNNTEYLTKTNQAVTRLKEMHHKWQSSGKLFRQLYGKNGALTPEVHQRIIDRAALNSTKNPKIPFTESYQEELQKEWNKYAKDWKGNQDQYNQAKDAFFKAGTGETVFVGANLETPPDDQLNKTVLDRYINLAPNAPADDANIYLSIMRGHPNFRAEYVLPKFVEVQAQLHELDQKYADTPEYRAMRQHYQQQFDRLQQLMD